MKKLRNLMVLAASTAMLVTAGCGGGGASAATNKSDSTTSSSSSKSSSSSSTRSSTSSKSGTALNGLADDSSDDSSDDGFTDDSSSSSASSGIFVEDFKTDANGWGPTSNDNFTSTLGGGEFRWDIKKSMVLWYAPDVLKPSFADGTFRDVLVEATVTLNDANAVAAVGCRSTRPQKGVDGYLFTADANGLGHIVKVDSSGKATDLTQDFPYAVATKVGSEMDLAGKCQDTADGRIELTYSMNGVEQGSVTTAPSDPVLEAGGAIIASNSSDGSTGYSLTWTGVRMVANPS